MTEHLELDTGVSLQPEKDPETVLNQKSWNVTQEKQLWVASGSQCWPPHQASDKKSQSAENLTFYQCPNSVTNLCDNEVLKFCFRELKKDQFLATKKNSFCQRLSENMAGITSFRRMEVINMLSFASQLSISPETVMTAVHYFDSIIHKQFVQSYMVPSFSAAALWLATKLYEKEVFSSKSFLSYRSLMGSVSKKTLVEAESIILSTLGWKVNVTTTYHYIQIFSLLLRCLHKEFIYMAESLCKYMMIDERLSCYSYSVQAASCITISVRLSSNQQLYQAVLESLNCLSIPISEVFECSEILLEQTFGGCLQGKDQQMSPKSIREWE